ncbi:MAG: NIL domain-containing protein [Euryarchaeota archaeon]|nr:NIL domain-containing protein [Euryarchaeota archaeon]
MVSQKIVLTFPKTLVEQPITYEVIKKYDLTLNILKAQIRPDEEGVLVIEISGDKKDCDAATTYLTDLGVRVEPVERDIRRDEERCVHCSACIAHCPPKALYIADRKSMKVEFDKGKCILCEACISVCPVHAMSVKF